MLSMTIVENRRLDRSTRYTLYLNDGRGYCAELACGPTVDHVCTDTQVNLTAALASLRDRTVPVEVISTDIAETVRSIDTMCGDRALSVQEYCDRYKALAES